MFDANKLQQHDTPYYYYDLALLRETIETALELRPSDAYKLHYAIKANNNPVILSVIAGYGLGADCVSIGEMRQAIEAGFDPGRIVFAGVGKRDEEIRFAIEHEIECLNVESHEELTVIADIAAAMGRTARVALRVNPDIDAHTHSYITTGLEEVKFGIDRRLLDRSVQFCLESSSLEFVGLHFHIGSQILTVEPFELLCQRVNEFVDSYRDRGVNLKFIDLGGGLGVDYDDPDSNPVADFKSLYDTVERNLRLDPGQQCIFEFGRALVAQCGSLITRVVFVKEGIGRKFVILDAGMNDLIRPALYQAHHAIQNLTASPVVTEVYDVVGPICETDDCFAKDERLPMTRRGDLVAIRTAGAYGESMASCYNSRPLIGAVFSE